MPEPILASTLVPLVAAFSGCFTAPSFWTFRQLVNGWILCLGTHTVTGVLRASGAIGQKHHSSFHRFFRSTAWTVEDVGLQLVKLVMKLLPEGARILLAVDDTLGRHTGKHICGASMHHDPLLSTRAKPFFHWGHVWVVLSIVIEVPGWKKSFALPVLVRLYRSKKTCEREGRKFLKKTELAAELIAAFAAAVRGHPLTVIVDSAYANASIVKPLPPNVHIISRSRMDAALYARPQRNRRGRPRVKGQRLPSPEGRTKSATGWRELEVEVYGRSVTVEVKVFEALWYVVGGGRPLRFMLVRGWPGHNHDDVFFTTDLARTASEMIVQFCQRWNLEVTFHECKDKLGFEEPQNRADAAVERTAPMAFWVYSLTVTWYLLTGKTTPGASIPSVPWYEKTVPTFSDMLAALRRETWRARFLDPSQGDLCQQKNLEPLLEAMAYAS